MPRSPRDADRSSTLGTLFRYELKMLLRDRRMLFFSVVLPLLLIPAFIFLINFTESRAEERREARTYQYAVLGARAELVRELLEEAAGMADAAPEDAGGLEEVQPANPDSALEAGEIDVIVEAWSAAEVRARRDSLEAVEGEEPETPGVDAAEMAEPVLADAETVTEPPVPLIELRFRGNRDESQEATARVRDRLLAAREQRREEVYRSAGFPVDPDLVATVEREETATAERESGAQLALWLTPMLVLLMLSGGSIVAADTISGEKERGTLETLLTTSARRRAGRRCGRPRWTRSRAPGARPAPPSTVTVPPCCSMIRLTSTSASSRSIVPASTSRPSCRK